MTTFLRQLISTRLAALLLAGAIAAPVLVVPAWAGAGASRITGYEIVADPAIASLVAPLKPIFLANVGKPLTPDVQKADVRRLQDLGQVAMVRTGVRPYKEGQKLLYKVEANPVIRSIELDGLTLLPADEVLKEFTSKPGQVLDYTKLFTDLNKIPELVLSKKGIMYTDVIGARDVQVTDGNVKVTVREFAMGDLVLKGVSGAEADLVRRAFRVKRGQPVVRTQLLTSLCDIFQLSMVEDVDWHPKFDREAGRVDMVLEVTRKEAEQAVSAGQGSEGGGD